jgi:hypothetical protein
MTLSNRTVELSFLPFSSRTTALVFLAKARLDIPGGLFYMRGSTVPMMKRKLSSITRV